VDLPAFLGPVDVATYLGVPERSARTYVAAIPGAFKAGRHLRVSREDFLRWIETEKKRWTTASTSAARSGGRVSTASASRRGAGTARPARLWRAERERERADPAYAAAHAATVDGVIAEWLGEVRAQTKKQRAAGTIEMHETKAGHLSRVFGLLDGALEVGS